MPLRQVLIMAGCILTLGTAAWLAYGTLSQPGPEDAGYFGVEQVLLSPYGAARWLAGGAPNAGRLARVIGQPVVWRLRLTGRSPTGALICDTTTSDHVEVELREVSQVPGVEQTIEVRGILRDVRAGVFVIEAADWRPLQ